MKVTTKVVFLSFLASVAVVPLAVGQVNPMKMPSALQRLRHHATLDATDTNQAAFDRVSIQVGPFSVPNYRD